MNTIFPVDRKKGSLVFAHDLGLGLFLERRVDRDVARPTQIDIVCYREKLYQLAAVVAATM